MVRVNTPATENRACWGPRDKLAPCYVDRGDLIQSNNRRVNSHLVTCGSWLPHPGIELCDCPRSAGRVCPLIWVDGVVGCDCLPIAANLDIVVLENAKAAEIDWRDLARVHVRNGAHLFECSSGKL